MPSPFPGMDPYLENPELWPEVHNKFISVMQDMLNPALLPHYVARMEARIYISDIDDPGREVIIPDLRVETTPKLRGARKPKQSATSVLEMTEPIIIPFLVDDEIEETFLTVRHLQSESLVTIIEVLSPTNKIRGSRGRASFLNKRRDVLATKIHWVEIDLLRTGDPSIIRPPLKPCDYRVMVYRANERPRGRYWPCSLQQPLPVVGIPLKGKDPDIPIDLSAILNTVYENAAYHATIDYRKPPTPPLNADDTKWANALLREKRLRR